MSASMLLRSIRRRAALEETNLDEFARAVFPDPESGGLDREPSVYAIEEAQICQVHAETLASGCDRPNFNGTSVDLKALERGELKETPGDVLFTFSKAVHREIHLTSEEDVRALAEALFEQRRVRERVPDPVAMRSYVKKCLDGGDSEWKNLCELKKQWKKWANATPAVNDTTAAPKPPTA